VEPDARRYPRERSIHGLFAEAGARDPGGGRP